VSLSHNIARRLRSPALADKNPHEWIARAKKVEKLLAVIRRRNPSFTALDAETLPETQWLSLAREADVNPPSTKTRRFVIAQLRLHEPPDSIDVEAPLCLRCADDGNDVPATDGEYCAGCATFLGERQDERNAR
jgi:hypothetical protein